MLSARVTQNLQNIVQHVIIVGHVRHSICIHDSLCRSVISCNLYIVTEAKLMCCNLLSPQNFILEPQWKSLQALDSMIKWWQKWAICDCFENKQLSRQLLHMLTQTARWFCFSLTHFCVFVASTAWQDSCRKISLFLMRTFYTYGNATLLPIGHRDNLFRLLYDGLMISFCN